MYIDPFIAGLLAATGFWFLLIVILAFFKRGVEKS